MNDRVAVYMLDVGQGDSTIVLLPDDRVVIFDCADDYVLRKILDGWKTPAIAAQRKRVITEQNQWTEPQYRHLTDKRRQIISDRLEVPCAGTVVVKLYLDGRVEVLPSRGGEHERIVDDWQHPLCRPPAL